MPRQDDPVFARRSRMAQRYDVSGDTWDRYSTGPNADPELAPVARTPRGDALWDVANCDRRMKELLTDTRAISRRSKRIENLPIREEQRRRAIGND